MVVVVLMVFRGLAAAKSSRGGPAETGLETLTEKGLLGGLRVARVDVTRPVDVLLLRDTSPVDAAAALRAPAIR